MIHKILATFKENNGSILTLFYDLSYLRVNRKDVKFPNILHVEI